MMDVVKNGLEQHLPSGLVSELLAAYHDVKENYYLSRFRPNEVEGGRFAEAVFRILEYRVGNQFTPIGKPLDTEGIIDRMQKIPFGGQPESIRLHIPRTLRLVYDIRNKRDAAHLADGIDPNPQDATLVVALCDWMLAELVRLYHSVSPEEAQAIVDGLVERKTLVVQDFNGFLKTQKPEWGPRERILATLYQRGKAGATAEEITSWLKPGQRPNAARALRQLEHDHDHIVPQNGRYFVTNRGLKYVEKSGMLIPE